MENKLLVLSSSSLGYTLYDFENNKEIISKPKNKLFYKDNTSISIGDYVLLDDDNKIYKILDRKNKLRRPNVSNIDLAITLVSSKEPNFSSYLLDKYLTINNIYQIPSLIVITKKDLLDDDEFNVLKTRMKYYERIGYKIVFLNCNKRDDEFKNFVELLKNKIVCLIGQTGVGKSSLLNLISPTLERKVDKNDKIFGRGRHTTKDIKIFKTDTCFIFDTPGFSSYDIDFIKPIDVARHFPGYVNFFSKCKFNDCLHEKNNSNCEIIKQLNEDYLSLDSYLNYDKILTEVKSFDVWKKKI